MPVLAVLGDTNLTGDGVFALAKMDDGVRAEKLLPDGLRLVKEFHIGSNYLVDASGAAGKHDGPAARAAGAAMGRGHGEADGRGRQLFLHVWRRDVVQRREERNGHPVLFQPQHDLFLFLSPSSQDGIPGRRQRRVLGGGEQPVFHPAGDDGVERAGVASRRAPGHAAGVSRRGADAGRAVAAGSPGGAGVSGADTVGEFIGVAANRPVRGAEGIPDAGGHRRRISKSRGQRDGLQRLFRLLRQAAAAGDELAAGCDEARLRVGDCACSPSCCARFSGH